MTEPYVAISGGFGKSNTPATASPSPIANAATAAAEIAAVNRTPTAAASGDTKDVKSGGAATPQSLTLPSNTGGSSSIAVSPGSSAPAPLTAAQHVELKFASELSELVGMGIPKPEVIDALIICGQNKDIVARVTEYLFATPARKEAIRLAEMEKKLRKAEDTHKAEMDRISTEFNAKKRRLQLEAYTAFLSTLLVDGYITPSEVKKIEVQRNHSDVSDSEHRQILISLGVAGGESGSAWSKMISDGQARAEKLEVSSDCAHCHNVKHQLVTDHIVMDCMHLCLCEECAPIYMKPNSKCPKCGRPARKVVKTFR